MGECKGLTLDFVFADVDEGWWVDCLAREVQYHVGNVAGV